MNLNNSKRIQEIKRLSYLKAEQAGFPPELNQKFWLEAEQEYDAMIARTAPNPKIVYSAFSEKFFSRSDIDWKQTSEVGKEYLIALNQDNQLFKDFFSLEKTETRKGLFDVSLLTQSNELSDFVKRSLLMSDSSLLGYADNNMHEFHYKEESVMQGYFYQGYIWEANIGSLKEFGKNILDCKPALLNGDLLIAPKVQLETGSYGEDAISMNSHIFENFIFDASVQSRKVKKIWTPSQLKANYIKYLAQIQIPVIENVNMGDFVKIYFNEIDAANSLKVLLREYFLSLDIAQDDEHLEQSIMRIGNNLEKEAALVTKDMKHIHSKRAIMASGAVVGTVLGTLVAVNAEMLGDFANLISGVGGLGALFGISQQILSDNNRISQNPYLFFWLLERKANR